MKYPDKLIESYTHGKYSNSALIKTAKSSAPAPPAISCEGATNEIRFSIQEPKDGYQLNHTTLVYNINVDGVDYGEFDMLSSGFIQLGDVAIEVYADSGGNAAIYAAGHNGAGGVTSRFTFTPREDMTDANIWGVFPESNPTVVYDSDRRSMNVCLYYSLQV